MFSPVIKLTSSNEVHLAEVLRITPGHRLFTRATVCPTEIVLLSSDSTTVAGAVPLPFDLTDPAQIANFLRAWLASSVLPEKMHAHMEKGWVLTASRTRITLTATWLRGGDELPRAGPREGHRGHQDNAR